MAADRWSCCGQVVCSCAAGAIGHGDATTAHETSAAELQAQLEAAAATGDYDAVGRLAALLKRRRAGAAAVAVARPPPAAAQPSSDETQAQVAERGEEGAGESDPGSESGLSDTELAERHQRRRASRNPFAQRASAEATAGSRSEPRRQLQQPRETALEQQPSTRSDAEWQEEEQEEEDEAEITELDQGQEEEQGPEEEVNEGSGQPPQKRQRTIEERLAEAGDDEAYPLRLIYAQ